MGARKSIVITGAASGIGAATAELAYCREAEVTAIDIKLPAFAVDHFRRCDLADSKALDAVVAALPEEFDALVNVAGLPGPEPALTVMGVNFLALRHLCEALLARLRPGGAIVNVSSIAGRDWQRRADVVRPLLETPDFETGLAWCEAEKARWARDPYTFSKQCVTAYTLGLVERALKRGVRCNVISPGGVDTPISPDFTRQMGEAQVAWINAQVGRQAKPAEIAEVIVYAALGPCTWLSGADIPVDNGYTAGLAAGWIDFTQSPAALARAAAKAQAPNAGTAPVQPPQS